MPPTPELSPSQSPTSSDGDTSFSSALSTGAASPFQKLAYASLEPSKSEIHSDVLVDEGEMHLYTQNLIYPISLDPQVTRSDYFTVSRFDIGRSRPIATLPSIDKPASDPEPCRGALRRRGSDSLSAAPNGQLSRANHPSFVKFPETLPPNKPQLHGLRSPHPRRLPHDMSTEALISLAWTGEISSPIVALGYVRSRIGDTYMWPRLKMSDTEVIGIRRASWPRVRDYQGDATKDEHSGIDTWFHQDNPSPQHKRWTLSVAISDDRVTDETFIELLEELRLRRLCSTGRSTLRFLPDPATPMQSDPEPFDGSDNDPFCNDSTSGDIFKAWLVARRTLLVCRELIRTERHYLLSLKVLSRGETQSPVPPLMLSRLSPLVRASSLLLSEMETNPSVLGICTAFTHTCEQLEEAFMQWCRVAGQFFTDSDSTSLVKRSNSAPAKPGPVGGEAGPVTLTKRVGSWGKKMHSRTPTIDDVTSMITRNSKQKSQSKPSVRDLAILPTQRITRYGLLFKDLQAHSLPPDIRIAAEHAVEAAMTLAQKADSAQDHPAFRMVP